MKMITRAVAAARGWEWIVEGFQLFRRSPLIWMVLTLALALMWIVSFAIPIVGPLLFNLLSPVLFAGLMLGCRAIERGEELELAHLFAGFKTHASPLVTIGGVYLVGTILIVGAIFVTAGGSMLPTVLSKSPGDIEKLGAALRSLALALTVGFAFYIPLLMLIWFAPLLVVFHDLPAAAAMRLSFAACWANLLPFTVYGAALLVLWFIASIPLLLGLVVLLPVIICSIYTSYKDIFEAEAGVTRAGTAPP
jgi:uncharacterized membrane protein